MRIAALALAALAATGCMGRTSSGGEESTSPAANLEISISIRGSEAPTKVWTLHCPAGGTLPNAADACRKLGELQDPFAPIPKGAACTQIYGGPEIADVRGSFRGRPVAAHFSRGNGCEIARWNRVRFLFPGVS
jgi:hypothetical protein